MKALQITAWIMLAALFFFENLRDYPNIWLVSIASINSLVSFALVIYGYINFIHPRFSRKVNFPRFVIINLVFLAIITIIRVLVYYVVVEPYSHSDAARPKLAFEIISIFIAFIIAVLLKSVLNNLDQQKRETELKGKQTEAEMKWLKAQIQPHFLFNALNNIYYEAQEKTARTPELIEKLASIMRYLLEETTKGKVFLIQEINFINNYIAFENLRLHSKIHISFLNRVPENTAVPPLLLMPLIENIFKHGIDRDRTDNSAEICLEMEGKYLVFKVSNKIAGNKDKTTGFGLANLRERLEIIYQNDFTLKCEQSDDQFHSYLKIPV